MKSGKGSKLSKEQEEYLKHWQKIIVVKCGGIPEVFEVQEAIDEHAKNACGDDPHGNEGDDSCED